MLIRHGNILSTAALLFVSDGPAERLFELNIGKRGGEEDMLCDRIKVCHSRHMNQQKQSADRHQMDQTEVLVTRSNQHVSAVLDLKKEKNLFQLSWPARPFPLQRFLFFNKF